MTEKNTKKQRAKKQRNFWTCAPPLLRLFQTNELTIVSDRKILSIRKADMNEDSCRR